MAYTEQDVERVAEAIYKADPCFYTYNAGDWEPSNFYSDDLEEHWREVARKQARAALEAVVPDPPEDVLTTVGLRVALEAQDRVLDAVYRERNQVVAALSKCFPAWIGPVDDAEPGWTHAVYIDLPTGQVSWHISDAEMSDLFGHLSIDESSRWDGHTTEDKYARLAALEAMEDVLRAQHVYNIQIEPAGPNFYAEVVSAAHDRRTGTGATIDDAIRAAVAAAEEER